MSSRSRREVDRPAPCSRGADLVLAADGVNSLGPRALRRALRAADRLAARTASSGSAPRSRSPPSRSSSRQDGHGLFRVHAYRYDASTRPSSSSAPRRPGARRARRGQRGRDGRLLRAALRRASSTATRCSRTARSGAASRRSGTRAGTTATSCCSATPRTPRTSRSARAPSWRWRTRSRSARGARRARGPSARRSPPTRPRAGPRSRRCSAPRRSASSGSRRPSATTAGSSRSQFAFSLLTRSLRITHENLKVRDRRFVAHGRRWFAAQGRPAERRPRCRPTPPPPPMFTPFRLRELRAAPTASSSRRCASTRPRTACPTTGTSCTSAAARVGGAGLVMTEMTDVSREAPHQPGCTGMYKPEHVAAWKRIVDFVHGQQPGADRHAARARRPQGLDPQAVGGHRRAAAGGQLAARLGLAAPVLPAQPGAARDGPRRHGRVRDEFVRAARMAEWRPASTCSSSTSRTATCSPASSRRSPTAARDAYGGSLEQPAALPARGLRRRARGLAGGQADLGAHLGHRLGPAGSTPADAVAIARALHGARLRHHRRLGRPDRPRRAAGATAGSTRRRSPSGSATRPASRR